MLVDSSRTYQWKSTGCPAKFCVCDVSEMVSVKWIIKCLPTEHARNTTSCSIYIFIYCLLRSAYISKTKRCEENTPNGSKCGEDTTPFVTEILNAELTEAGKKHQTLKKYIVKLVLEHSWFRPM